MGTTMQIPRALAICFFFLSGCTLRSVGTPLSTIIPEMTATDITSISTILTSEPPSTPVPTFGTDRATDAGPEATDTQPASDVVLIKLYEWTRPFTRNIKWNPDGDRFVIADANVELYDGVTHEEVWVFEPVARAHAPTGLEFSLDGETLFLYSRLEGLQVIDAHSGELLNENREGNSFGLCFPGDAGDVSWTPYGDSLFISITDERLDAAAFTELHIWDIGSLRCQEVYGRTHGFAHSLDLNSNGLYVALGTILDVDITVDGNNVIEFGQVLIWELETLMHRQVCTAGRGAIAIFRPHTNILVSPDPETGLLSYWDVETCTVVKEIEGIDTPYALAFSPEGELLFAVSDQLLVLDAETGEILLTVDHPSFIDPPNLARPDITISISPNGRFLLTQAPKLPDQSTLVLWELER